ncbi:hypothetical protein cypCar_00026417 [Cyprinus carpio]|nr:hypothetical protein cypCar_00026417 [Cyprinus carpio]
MSVVNMSSRDKKTDSDPRHEEDQSSTASEDNKQIICLGNNEVKSRAVVKYSAAPPPSSYALLQEKTDLKLPPANWLRENTQLGTAGTTVLGSSRKSKPFSSFGMAYDFIDCIGDDVDVVSDSENIKKLLKIPYSKSHVSMAVHRVGGTLLLDELDIQELFMRSSQTGDWTWLKEFYQRLSDQKWQRKKKSKEHWNEKAILSKFLYYSINSDGTAVPVPSDTEQAAEEGCGTAAEGPSWPATYNSPTTESNESATPKEEQVDTYTLGHVSSVSKEQNLPTLFNEGENSQGLRNDFVRNILWTFEDIHMLVGSNMPIFGGGRYPAVSLRLRLEIYIELINFIWRLHVLPCDAGVKDWGSPEISCHCLKSTYQRRHTYWLFKASGSDIVKLYDLTTLCEEAEEEKCQNPFTLPVAVLLYKVASNMMLKKSQNRKNYGTIRTLLLNCIKLLDEERHPQIIASAHYMLAELFQLDDVSEDEGNGESLRGGGSEDSYSDEEEEEEEEEEEDESCSYSTSFEPQDDSKAVAIIKSVGELSVPEKYKSTHQIRPNCAFPVSQDKEEKCRLVLSYVLKGLKAVDSSIKKESDLPAADPSTPIPLKYEERSQNRTRDVEKEIALLLDRVGPCYEDLNVLTRSGMLPGTWQHRMKLQLFLKASKAYYILSDAATNLLKYGRALRYIKLALQCHDGYCSISGGLHPQVLLFHCQCLSLCGDVQLMLAQNASNRAAYLEEYNYQTKDDQEILHCLHRESSCQAFSMATDLASDPEYQLIVSSKCYEAAHDLLTSGVLKDLGQEQLGQVLKRLGNIRNEMGVFYMNQAAAMQAEKQGALLLCNIGRRHAYPALRLTASPTSEHSRGESSSPEEALYYNKVGDESVRKQHKALAEQHYSKAVRLFISLSDAPCELLRTLLERVAFAEFTMAGQNSSAVKLKTLTGALEVMCETRHAFKLIHKELLEQQEKIMTPEDSDRPEELHEASDSSSSSELNSEEVLKLTSVFEPSFSFLLLQLIKLSTTSKRKLSGKEEEQVKIYKNVYSRLLRAEKSVPLIQRVSLFMELLDQLKPPTGSDEARPSS